MKSVLKALALGTVLCAAVAGCSTTGVSSQAKPVVLENTSWMLQVEKTADCDAVPYLEFLPGNRVTGDLGCNRATGSFEFDGHSILMDKVGVTRRMCGPQYMALEARMLKVINESRSVSQSDKGLAFYDAEGKEIETLVPEVVGSCY